MATPKDTISRASWTLMEGAKDSAQANITAAVMSKQIEVKPEHVAKLLALINASIEEGYHKGFKSFNRTVEIATEATSAPPAPSKKKSG